MTFQRTLAAALLACSSLAAHAQVSVEKQKLIDRVLTLWKVEDAAVVMIQRPAADAMQQAGIALQGRVSAEKHKATMKDIATDVQKYIDEATPIVKTNATKLKAPTIGPLLAQNFSEEELRQLVALLESPVKKKFETMLPQFEKAYGEKIAAESRASIDPKLQKMTQDVGLKLRAATVAP